jgi:hypothetical protein
MQAIHKILITLAFFALLTGLTVPLQAAPNGQDADALANATYLSEYTESGTVTLTDGEFDDRDNFIHVVLTEWIASGDLNGDGVEDDAVILATNTGGSGIFLDLHAMLSTDEGPIDAATAFLGDRVQINALTVADGVITVDMITQGPDDPFCCPTQPVVVRYMLEGDELVAEQQAGINLTTLENLTYTLPDMALYAEGGAVTLVDGTFAVEAAPGSAEKATVNTTGYAAFGDLDGDATEDAAVALAAHTGGTGTFIYLASVLNQDGEAANNAVTLLGDRVQVDDLAIEDGTIVVTMIAHGPDDPLCCPTRPVEQVYALEGGQLSLLMETELPGVPAGNLGELDPAAEARYATINLGGTDQFWLDPTMISLFSGVASGPAVDASLLGSGCAGQIPARPDVVLNWTADENVDTLRFFFLSMGDPTMLIVSPDGEYLCSDDYNPLVLDPIIEIPDPVAGRYAIFMGAFEDAAITPGFLTITSQPYTPANLDIGQLMPRELPADDADETLAPDVLGTVASVSATIDAADTPVTQSLTGGGDLEAFNIELGNPLCTGFIGADPTYSFEWSGEAEALRLFFEGDGDSTLIVKTPLDDYQCNDDADGAANLNPLLDLTPVEGAYLVWVGSFAPDMNVAGTLTVTGSTGAGPTPLSSAILEEN